MCVGGRVWKQKAGRVCAAVRHVALSERLPARPLHARSCRPAARPSTVPRWQPPLRRCQRRQRPLNSCCRGSSRAPAAARRGPPSAQTGQPTGRWRTRRGCCVQGSRPRSAWHPAWRSAAATLWLPAPGQQDWQAAGRWRRWRRRRPATGGTCGRRLAPARAPAWGAHCLLSRTAWPLEPPGCSTRPTQVGGVGARGVAGCRGHAAAWCDVAAVAVVKWHVPAFKGGSAPVFCPPPASRGLCPSAGSPAPAATARENMLASAVLPLQDSRCTACHSRFMPASLPPSLCIQTTCSPTIGGVHRRMGTP